MYACAVVFFQGRLETMDFCQHGYKTRRPIGAVVTMSCQPRTDCTERVLSERLTNSSCGFLRIVRDLYFNLKYKSHRYPVQQGQLRLNCSKGIQQ